MIRIVHVVGALVCLFSVMEAHAGRSVFIQPFDYSVYHDFAKDPYGVDRSAAIPAGTWQRASITLKIVLQNVSDVTQSGTVEYLSPSSTHVCCTPPATKMIFFMCGDSGISSTSTQTSMSISGQKIPFTIPANSSMTIWTGTAFELSMPAAASAAKYVLYLAGTIKINVTQDTGALLGSYLTYLPLASSFDTCSGKTGGVSLPTLNYGSYLLPEGGVGQVFQINGGRPF